MAPRPEVTLYVRNQSSRNGLKPSLIVLHDTEGGNVPGVTDLRGVGAWFDNPAAQASAHVCNDAEGNDARFVPDERKAWHCMNFNSVSLGIEQIGFASQKQWPDAQLKNTADWVAYWSKKYGIPLAHSTHNGVCMHSDLGAAGGGHHDPGPAYPFDRVLELARRATPAADPKLERWRRSLRIVRAKAARRGWLLPFRIRGRKLKSLIEREESR